MDMPVSFGLTTAQDADIASIRHAAVASLSSLGLGINTMLKKEGSL